MKNISKDRFTIGYRYILITNNFNLLAEIISVNEDMTLDIKVEEAYKRDGGFTRDIYEYMTIPIDVIERMVRWFARSVTESDADYYGLDIDNPIEITDFREENETDDKYDKVYNPSHYSLKGYDDLLDVIEEIFTDEQLEGVYLYNLMKYRFRAGKKNGSNKWEDLEKANNMKNKLVQLYRKGL